MILCGLYCGKDSNAQLLKYQFYFIWSLRTEKDTEGKKQYELNKKRIRSLTRNKNKKIDPVKAKKGNFPGSEVLNDVNDSLSTGRESC